MRCLQRRNHAKQVLRSAQDDKSENRKAELRLAGQVRHLPLRGTKKAARRPPYLSHGERKESKFTAL